MKKVFSTNTQAGRWLRGSLLSDPPTIFGGELKGSSVVVYNVKRLISRNEGKMPHLHHINVSYPWKEVTGISEPDIRGCDDRITTVSCLYEADASAKFSL